MFLKSIHLTNVRCFENVTISFMKEDSEFVRQWTILLGENGTGKSTLLKAIALVTSGSDALSDLLPNPDDWIRYGAEACELSAILVTKDQKERNISLRIQRGDRLRDIFERNREGLKLLDQALDHANRNYFVVGFGASRRLSSRDTVQSKSSVFHSVRAQNVATLFDPDATLNPLESWAMDLDYRHETGLSTVREVLDEFLPDATFHEIDKRNNRLLFETADGIVSLRSLSDGYQSMAAWIGDLLYRVMEVFGDYRSPLKARGLLLIDEIDLHLHPQWQRQLLSFLGQRLPNFQLVISTHSPITAQQAGRGQLYYAKRENGRIEIEQFAGNPRELLLNQLIMTDAFGLETDESLELETKKARYRKLRNKAQTSQSSLKVAEREEFEQLKRELGDRPVTGRYTLLSDDEKELLQVIKQETGRGLS